MASSSLVQGSETHTWKIPSISLAEGMRVILKDLGEDLQAYNNKCGTIIRVEKKVLTKTRGLEILLDNTNVKMLKPKTLSSTRNSISCFSNRKGTKDDENSDAVSTDARYNSLNLFDKKVVNGERKENMSIGPLIVYAGKTVKINVGTKHIGLMMVDGSIASEWSGCVCGSTSVYKRVVVRYKGEKHYGVAPGCIEIVDPINGIKSVKTPTENGFSSVAVYLDIGTQLLLPRRGVLEVPELNERSWTITAPLMHATSGSSNCAPEGSYPVYFSPRHLSETFGKVLEAELRHLERTIDFDHYHDSEGKGNWKPKDHAHAEQTLVRVLYGYDCDREEMPCQNPCGGVQWSSSSFEPPYIRMPPATRFLSRLMKQGNPEVKSALGQYGEKLYACAALTLYRHRNKVGSALDWHMDKSLGVETACVSIALNGRGNKTIGISNSAFTSRGHTTFKVPPNSIWWANAKAISHAVGNDDNESATIIFRLMVPRSSYEWFYPEGAHQISTRLHAIKRRFFPVLTEADAQLFSTTSPMLSREYLTGELSPVLQKYAKSESFKVDDEVELPSSRSIVDLNKTSSRVQEPEQDADFSSFVYKIMMDVTDVFRGKWF